MPTSAAAGFAPVERFFQFSLLGLLTSGFLAIVGSGALDALSASLVAVSLLLRALLVTGTLRFAISDRWITAATLAYIGFYPIDYYFLSGEFLPATVHLLFYLAAAKILTARSSRDYLFVKIIAFLEILAASILSANLNFFICLGLFLIFGVATFCSSEIRHAAHQHPVAIRSAARPFPWRLAFVTLTIASGILLMTAGMFFLLPRTARAAFRHLIPPQYRITGFANEVTLGGTGAIRTQTTPVMHIRVEEVDGPVPVKWKGTTLGRFDGRRWSNPPASAERLPVQRGLLQLAPTRLQRPGHRLGYQVHLKNDTDTLFFTGTPEFLNVPVPSVYRNGWDSYRVGSASPDGLRYAAYSFVPDERVAPATPPPPLTPQQRSLYLQTPPTDVRIIQLARDLTDGGRGDLAKAQLLEEHFRTRFSYTLDQPEQPVSDPLAHFLFERRQGHCEYFASAMTVMLRTLGIPARIAAGYQSGIYNPVSGWHIIRAMDAHSWVEAFLPDRGWTTFDPTPANPDAATMTLGTQLALYLDAVEMFWQDWVVNYDLERQLHLAATMEQSSRKFSFRGVDDLGAWFRDWRTRASDSAWRVGPPLLGVLLVSGILWIAGPGLISWYRLRQRYRRLERGEASVHDATLLYARMLEVLRKRGIEKPAWLTPLEFARVLPPSETAELVQRLTLAYNDLRFGGKREAAPQLLKLLSQLDAQ